MQQLLASSNATPVKFYQKFYCCGYCSERFLSPKKLKFHTEEDHAIDTFTHKQREKVVKLDVTNLTCKLCGNSMESIQDLIKHLGDDHEKKFPIEDVSTFIIPFIYEDKLKCAICGVSFSSSRGLMRHMNAHIGNFICDFCNASYMKRDVLELHLKKIHSNIHHVKKIKTDCNGYCKCSHCGLEFLRASALRMHLKEKHGETKVHPCQSCERTFENSGHLRRHIMRDHLKERKFKCNLCEKSFFSKDKLSRHLPIHTGEAKHLCDVCPKAFKALYNLIVHKKTHTNDKPFKCMECHLAYAQKSWLRAHMKSKHGGDEKITNV